MALNRNEFILKEATIQYGTWANPHAIVPGTNPSSSFTATGNFGYIRMGTVKVGLNDTFAEYKAGTPHKMIRKDLLERIYTLEFTANQFNPTNYQIFYNLDVDSGTYNLGWIGSDAPVKTRYGFLLTGTKVDGTSVYIAVWAGEVTTEDKSLTFSGTDYVDIPVKIQAFEGDTFAANPNDEHNYGMIYEAATS